MNVSLKKKKKKKAIIDALEKSKLQAKRPMQREREYKIFITNCVKTIMFRPFRRCPDHAWILKPRPIKTECDPDELLNSFIFQIEWDDMNF